MLIEIVALVTGVVFLILVSLLRHALSITFFKYTIDLLQKNFTSSQAWNDLYIETKKELERVGFVHVGWVSIKANNAPSHAGIFSSVISVFTNEAQVSQVLVMPPIYLNRPNTLSITYVSWCENNTVLSSQVFDPTSELVANGKTFFAQTLTTDSIEQQRQQHLAWRHQFSFKPSSTPCQIQHLLKSFNYLFAETDRLLEANKVWQDKNGFIRPTLGFALHIIKAMRQYSKSVKPDNTLTSIDRLIEIFTFAKQRQQQASLSTCWQWGLFTVSCLLFIVLGYIFFGGMIASLLLITIVLHEAGHYLTMRAFGYKNTQIIALPLLGGVTTGIKEEESTTQCAWVNIMGPLPGIILAWGLLVICILYAPQLHSLNLDSWLFYGVIMLLIINYLNLLPITPLDGGNILQCLLPPRWFGVKIILMALGCLLAVYIAWALNIYLIAIISLLQLFFTLPLLLRQRNMINTLLNNPTFVKGNKQQKLYCIVQLLTESATAKKSLNAQAIMQQAYPLLEIFIQQPIKKTQQLIIGSIYIILLVLPFLIVGFSSSLTNYIIELRQMTYVNTYKLPPEAQERLNQIQSRREIADKLSFEALLQTKLHDKLVAPASEQQIIAAENRLNHPLPDELKTLYRLSNGIPQLGILPIEQIILSSQWSGWNKLLNPQSGFNIINLEALESAKKITKHSLNLIYIGEPPENEYLFYRLNQSQGTQRKLISCYDPECTEYNSLHEMLKEFWIHQTFL